MKRLSIVNGSGETLPCHTLIIITIYIEAKFTCNGHWDAHIKDLVIAGKHQVNSVLRILQNPSLSFDVKRQLNFSFFVHH